MVFIDETWAKTNMTLIRGWFARGQRLVAKVPHGHWKTLTFIAGLRCDGICAPYVLDSPINAASFRAWVEQCLVPTLKPGNIADSGFMSPGIPGNARPPFRTDVARDSDLMSPTVPI